MKYPNTTKKINNRFSQISGCLILLIGFMSVFEIVMRTVFHSPTVWTADFSQYLLIWAVFLASGYAFQEHGHVKVDLFTSKMPPLLRKIMALISYTIAMGFVGILMFSTFQMLQRSMQFNKLTSNMVQIPQWILILAMIIGGIMMIVTLVCMLLDIKDNGKKYL